MLRAIKPTLPHNLEASERLQEWILGTVVASPFLTFIVLGAIAIWDLPVRQDLAAYTCLAIVGFVLLVLQFKKFKIWYRDLRASAPIRGSRQEVLW
jgi:hypothetical protein